MKGFELKRSTKFHKYFHGIDLPIPSEAEYKKYVKKWDDKYGKSEYGPEFNTENLLDEIFKEYNHSNKNVKEMFIKCVLLDKFYSTNIKHMVDLVQNLCNIDENEYKNMLENGTPQLVNIMKKVALEKDKDINYLSFASKYCKRYNEKCFPIYDTIVKDVLKHYLSTINFYTSDKNVDWSDYTSYKRVVDEFIKAFPFIENYVMLDRYLWTMGKEKLEGIKLFEEIEKAKDNKDNLNKIAQSIKYNGEVSTENLEEFVVKKYGLR